MESGDKERLLIAATPVYVGVSLPIPSGGGREMLA